MSEKGFWSARDVAVLISASVKVVQMQPVPAILLRRMLQSGTKVRSSDHVWSVSDAAANGARAARAMFDAGVRADSSVLIHYEGDAFETISALAGAWWLGARASIVGQTEGEVAIRRTARAAGAMLAVGNLSSRQSVARQLSFLSYEEIRTAAAMAAPADCLAATPAVDLTSSGTTGPPRVVSYSHAALETNAEGIGSRLALDATDLVYSPLPLYLPGVLGMVFLPAVMRNVSVILDDLVGADLARASSRISLFKPTVLYGTPYLYNVIARRTRGTVHDGLRLAFSSSAPLPEQTFQLVYKGLGVPPRSCYCLAEAATVTINSSSALGEVFESVGAPLDGTTISIDSLPGERVGRVRVSGPGCGLGYRQDGVLSPFPHDGILTNDRGYLKDGLLYLTGRADSTVVIGGSNVDLDDVTRKISDCPGLVEEFAVVVEDHQDIGAVSVVLVESERFSSERIRELLDYCRRNLPAPAVPYQVRTVREIPRADSGKPRMYAERGTE
ncbi:class I adenylate-forming enzyme family protein [Kribbella sp. NPDC051587]|uniref:class I adenylate-forming enzyme family protein n=1 Tax=Kribbella sp. NPDC051587 TaxID=3364119 RepID=UPI0037B4D372